MCANQTGTHGKRNAHRNINANANANVFANANRCIQGTYKWKWNCKLLTQTQNNVCYCANQTTHIFKRWKYECTVFSVFRIQKMYKQIKCKFKNTDTDWNV